jgi:hypothetical protein
VTPVSSQLLRYRDGHGDDWADIIDMLTMHPEPSAESATAARRDRACRATLGGRAGQANGEGLARCSRPPVTLGPPPSRLRSAS